MSDVLSRYVCKSCKHVEMSFDVLAACPKCGSTVSTQNRAATLSAESGHNGPIQYDSISSRDDCILDWNEADAVDLANKITQEARSDRTPETIPTMNK